MWNWKKLFKIFLLASCVTLAFCFIMDWILWIEIQYMIPSWTIAVTSLMCAILCYCLIEQVD